MMFSSLVTPLVSAKVVKESMSSEDFTVNRHLQRSLIRDVRLGA